MAKKPMQPVAAATSAHAGGLTHHQDMGMAAHGAMRQLGSTGAQVIGNPTNFANIPAQHEDFSPRVYAAKPNPKG